MQFISQSELETHKVAQDVLGSFPNHSVILLQGQLGSGKTTFTKGIASQLGIDMSKIKSPTYAYYNIYSGDKDLAHFDFYRIKEDEDVSDIMAELEEIMDQNEGYIVIEWPQRIPTLKHPHLLIRIEGVDDRKITITENV